MDDVIERAAVRVGGHNRWLGVLDFAGGIVVHITAGVAALVACIVIGPRKGYGTTMMAPHNMTMCVTGTGMLWIGWYGFNGGSALGANGDAAMAIAVTQISAATAAFTWMAIEWLDNGKPSALGLATGAIAGLAAVTPASGYIGPFGGFAIGLASGATCWWASTRIKIQLGYDDSLDVFGVHGVVGVDNRDRFVLVRESQDVPAVTRLQFPHHVEHRRTG